MRLKVLTYPDPVLKQVCEPIEEINSEIETLISNMVETMYEDDGVGLAAPQVGHSIRLITLDQTGPNERAELRVILNPEIIEHQGTVDSRESCLSVPAFSVTIKRHEKVIVTGLNEKGKKVKIEADGLLAIILQHEIDHLDGITIVDRASRLKRAMYDKKVSKWSKSK